MKYFSMSKASQSAGSTSTNGVDMAKQTKMMTNMFTIMIIVMSVFMTTALDLYWVTTNLFTIVQNIIVKRKVK